MWIQDIQMAINAMLNVMNPFTLIDRISSDDKYIIFTTTAGTKYYYDIHFGTIQDENELEERYTINDLGLNWW